MGYAGPPRGPGAGAATLSYDQALVAEAGWMVRETDGKPLLAMSLSMQAKWQAEDKTVLALILLPGGVRGPSKAEPARAGDDGTC